MSSITRKEEARALDVEEREMIAATHHPEVQALSDADLQALVTRVRDRRDRAQTIARQRRREMRGKGAPRGAEASRADAGSKLKAEILAAAMRRLNGEAERRRRLAARTQMVESQRRALAMVREAGAQPHEDFNSRTAHAGMRKNANRKTPRIGSAREAGRVSQFVKNAQAKRDSR
ncbi:MAG: hypothetical protein EA355_07695 [Rhodobacteraceae bacterium]|nr:MAG: hypothetical protein EA355_07695 [Paracoccaceae bacterium]